MSRANLDAHSFCSLFPAGWPEVLKQSPVKMQSSMGCWAGTAVFGQEQGGQTVVRWHLLRKYLDFPSH